MTSTETTPVMLRPIPIRSSENVAGSSSDIRDRSHTRRRPRLYTSPVKVAWTRPRRFRALSARKRLRGLSEEYLLAETDSETSGRKGSLNYQSFAECRPTVMAKDSFGDTDTNGAKNRSRKSIILGPPSVGDVWDEVDTMEASFRGRRRKTFCQQFRFFCQRSTLHGLSDLCRAENWWLRGFWVVTFIAAMAAAVYGCYHILEQYIQSPVVVSYFVQESDLKFPLPDLVICPFNRFNAEFLKNYSVPIDVAQHMQLVFGMSAKHPAQRRELYNYMTNDSMQRLDSAMSETLQRLNMTFDEFLEAASLKCSELFIDCAFPTGTAKCCNNITGVMTFAGKCYRIRGVDQSGPGYGYGMTIVVSLPKALYSLAVNNWLNDGILVKLAEPGQGIDYDMTFIPVGTHALMPLKATKYEFMDDPPRFECLTEASVNYSRVDCFDECFVEAAQNHCRCAMVGNFNRHKLPLCTTNQFYFCIFTYLTKQFEASTDSEHYFFGCRQRCKPRCTYWQYQSAISYSKFPSDEARPFAQSDEEWSRMRNTIIVDLYYEKLEFTRIKHYRAMTIHGFIANLGGQYSLWLGGSILTLMQLLVFLINYLLGRCRRFLRRANGDQSVALRRDFTYSSRPARSSGPFWRRSASAGAGARRPSSLSDDLHPQLQALTTQNYYGNTAAERRPIHSNGTCCSGFDDVYGTSSRAPSDRYDRAEGGQWLKRDESNGGVRRRSPSIEVEHLPRWEQSALDGFRQRQWTSET